MSIAKKKTSEGAMPADAFISFNGQTGKVKLEIKGKDGTTTKYEPTAINYLVLDEDFREVGGIRMGAPQGEGVKSNVCYGWENSYFKVRLNNGTAVAAGPWGTIKPKCELYKGRLENFSFVVLMKVGGTTNDAAINQELASGKVVAKVSYHGQTSFAYSAKQKELGTRDFAGHIITVKAFKKVKSEKSGLESYVPALDVTELDDKSPEYVNSVAVFLDRIEPYIKYVKNGGTSAELDEQAVPEASADDFIPDGGDFPTQEPVGDTGQPLADVPF